MTGGILWTIQLLLQVYPFAGSCKYSSTLLLDKGPLLATYKIDSNNFTQIWSAWIKHFTELYDLTNSFKTWGLHSSLVFLRIFFKLPYYFLYCISLLDDSSVLQLRGTWCVMIMLNFPIVFLLQKCSLNIVTTIIFLFWIDSTGHRDHQLLFMDLVETKNLQQSLHCTIGSTLFHLKKNTTRFRIIDS